MTREELIEEARRDNPPPLYADINGVEVELTPEEYEDALGHWADMRLAQMAGGDE